MVGYHLYMRLLPRPVIVPQSCHCNSAATELSSESVGANLLGAGALLHFIFSDGGSHC